MGKRLAEMEAVINLRVDDTGVQQQVENALKNAKKIADKDGIEYKVKVNKDGLSEILKLTQNVNKNGANAITLNFDKNATLKNFGETNEAIISQIEKMVKTIQTYLNNNNLGKLNFIEYDNKDIVNIKSQIDEQNKLYKEQSLLIDELNKKKENLKSKELENAFNNIRKNEYNNKNKNAEKYLAAFEDYDDTSKSKDIQFEYNGRKVKYDTLKNLYDSLFDDEDYIINMDDVDKIQSEVSKRHNDEITNIENQIKQIESKKNEIQNEINSLKSQLENININDEKKLKKEDLSTSNNKEKQDQSTTNINIKPINLDEFYKEIESYKKAEIEVEVKNKENVLQNLTDKPLEVKVDPKLDPNFKLNIPNISFDNKADNELKNVYTKSKKDFSVLKKDSNFNKIAEKLYSDISKQEVPDKKTLTNLLALNNVYKKNKGKDASLFSNVAKDMGLDTSQLKKQFKEVYDELKSSFNQKEDFNIPPIDIKLNVDESQISSLKTLIETGINPINVKLEENNKASDNSPTTPKASKKKNTVKAEKKEENSTIQVVPDLTELYNQLSIVNNTPIEINVLPNLTELYNQLTTVKNTPIETEVEIDLNKLKESLNTIKLPKDKLSLNLNEISEGQLNQPVLDLLTNINSIGESFNESGSIINNVALENISNIDTLTNSVKKLSNELKNVGISQIKDIEKSVKKLDTSKEANKNKETDKSLNKLKSQIDKIVGSTKIEDFNDKEKYINNKININDFKNYFEEIEKFNNKSKNNSFTKNQEELEKYITKVKEAISVIQELKSEQNLQSNKSGKLLLSEEGSLANFGKNSATKLAKKALETENDSVRNLKYNQKNSTVTADVISDGKIKKATVAIKEYNSALLGSEVQLRATYRAEKDYESAGTKWVNGFKAKIGNLTQYVTGIELVMRGWNELKQGFTFVKDVNSSLTTINQTMSVTQEELNNIGRQSIQTAKDLGTTADNVLSAVAVYANANETAEEILRKASPSVLLSNASGQDTSTSSAQIQSVVNQFSELEGQEEKIVNAYEKISSSIKMDFADGITAIADATSIAGDSASQAGLSFEELGSSVAKVVERTNQSSSTVATMYRTIMSRVSRAKDADENVTAEDRSDAAKALKSILDYDVYNDKGELKDFGDTLDTIAESWNNLSDAQRNNLSYYLGGTRGSSIFSSIITTWEEAKEIAQSTSEDSDYYLDVQEKYMESMEAKLAGLKASLQDFWYTLLNTNVINFVLQVGNVGLNVVNGLVKAFGTLGSVFGQTGSSITSLVGVIGTLTAAYKGFVAVSKTKSDTDSSSFIKPTIDLVKNSFKKQEDGNIPVLNLLGLNKDAIEKVKTAANEAGGGLSGIAAGGKVALSSMNSLSKGILGVSIALGTLKVAFSIFDYFVDSSEETRDKVKKLSDEYKAAQDTLKSNSNTINSISSEYKVLSTGVDQYGNNISLTTEQFERYHEICNQIAGIYPTLVQSYDSQGNAILNLKGNVEALNKEYEKSVLNAAKEEVNNLDEYLDNFNNTIGKKNAFTKLYDNVNGTLSGNLLGNSVDYQKAIDYLETLSTLDFSNVKAFLYNDKKASGFLNEEFNINASNISEDSWNEAKKNFSSKIAEYQSYIDSESKNVKNALTSFVKTLTLDKETYPQFSKMNDNVIQQVTKMLNNMSSDYVKQIGDTESELQSYTYDLLENISNSENAQNALSALFSIDDKTSVTDMKKLIEDNINILSNELKFNDKAELKLELGLDDKEQVVKKYDEIISTVNNNLKSKNKIDLFKTLNTGDMVNRVSNSLDRGNIKPESSSFTKSSEDQKKTVVLTPVLPNGKILSEEELNNYADELLDGKEIEPNIVLRTFEGKDSVKNAKKYNNQLNQSLKKYKNVKDYTKDISDFIEDQNINTEEGLNLLAECVDQTYSWQDAMDEFRYQSINIDVNDSKIQELEANLKTVEEDIENINEATEASYTSIGLNAEQIENIVSVFSGLDGYDYDQLFESTAEGVKLNAQELDRLNGLYREAQNNKYSDELSRLRDEYETLCTKIYETTDATVKNNLINEKNSLQKQIEQVTELQSRYEGLTNEVTRYLNAAGGVESGDNYDKITKGLTNVKDLYTKGLVGTNEFKSAVQMMTNEDLSGEGTGKYLEVYQKQFKKFSQYFTEDSTGLDKFLHKLQDLNMASVDKNGFWTINADLEEMSNKIGFSQSAITELFNKLKDYGFDIDFDESTEGLKDLKKEAEEAQKVFKDNKFKLNLDLDDKNKIDDVIKNSDKLRNQLIKDFGDGSKEVKAFDKQIEYLKNKSADLTKKEWEVSFSEDGIKKLNKSLETLKKNTDLDIEIDWTNQDPEYYEDRIKSVTDSLKDLKRNKDGTIDMSTKGANEAKQILQALLEKKRECDKENDVVLSVDTSKLSGETQKAVQDLQAVKTAADDLKELQDMQEMGFKVDTSEAENKLTKLTESFTSTHPTMAADLQLNNIDTQAENAVATIQSKVSGIKADMLVNAKVNPEALNNYQPEDKTATTTYKVDDTKVKEFIKANHDTKGTVTYGVNQDKVNAFKNKNHNKTATLTYNVKTNGSATLNGTAHINGTVNSLAGNAFLKGSWGAKKTEDALVGEVAPELRVNSKTGQWELLGENGAEFVKINKNDVIFNGKQTEELFKNGYVSSSGGRGKFAFLHGTAYASGTYTTAGSLKGSNKLYDKSKSKSKKKSTKKKSTNKKADDFLETIDWVEIYLERIQQAIEDLDTIANSVYKSFSKRNSTLASEYSKVTEEIKRQQQAYNTYMKKANSINLSETYKKKVRDGKLQIEDIKDENLANNIKAYQEWLISSHTIYLIAGKS